MSGAAAAWDAEYASGRYQHEPPEPFVSDILTAARRDRLTKGLYIGCGNGRNLLPLVDGGLDLIGIDISTEAITRLRARRPSLSDHLIIGDMSALPASTHYDLVIGIQVFQHGMRVEAHQHLSAAAARVSTHGLLCVRVNATETDVEHAHDRLEEDADDGSFTVRYHSGPKAGLDIHFFTATELRSIIGIGFIDVLPPRLSTTTRIPPSRGQWSQWEAIWRYAPAD
jgi:predicted TPR repeat methyltransferase